MSFSLEDDDSLQNWEEVNEEQLKGKEGTVSPEAAMVRLNYEKNYTKNIFIPILDYLSNIGLRHLYECSLGTREFFQMRNTASLSDIYCIISQPWYIKGVNSTNVIEFVCSKIMIAARIKKKLFHLKIAKFMLGTIFADEESFRKQVRKKVSQLIATRVKYDELFDFASIAHYLLYLMCHLLHDQPALDTPFLENQLKKEILLQMSAKDELGFYTELISFIFKSAQFKTYLFTSLPSKLLCLLKKREKQIEQKYGLPICIINWRLFMTEVAHRCFRSKRHQYKLSKQNLTKWIQKFNALYLKGNSNVRDYCKEFEIECDIEDEDITVHDEQSVSNRCYFDSKQFAPILLQVPLPTLEQVSSKAL